MYCFTCSSPRTDRPGGHTFRKSRSLGDNEPHTMGIGNCCRCSQATSCSCRSIPHDGLTVACCLPSRERDRSDDPEETAALTFCSDGWEGKLVRYASHPTWWHPMCWSWREEVVKGASAVVHLLRNGAFEFTLCRQQIVLVFESGMD